MSTIHSKSMSPVYGGSHGYTDSFSCHGNRHSNLLTVCFELGNPQLEAELVHPGAGVTGSFSQSELRAEERPITLSLPAGVPVLQLPHSSGLQR